MNKYIYFLFLLLFIAACEKENSTHHELGEVIVDTFEVQIVIDRTEGFKYPKVYHEINFVGHLNIPGQIADYIYTSPDVSFYFTADYSGYAPVGSLFWHKRLEWSSELLEVRAEVPYSFMAGAFSEPDQVYNFEIDNIAVVQEGYFGTPPVVGSEQITSSEDICYNPVYSNDMSWIYYKIYCKNDLAESINRMSPDGAVTEKLISINNRRSGLFTLVDDDTKLAYIQSSPTDKSKLIKVDIATLAQEEIYLDGYIWDSKLIKIPQSNKYICRSDPNKTNNFYSSLVIINTDNGTLEYIIDENEVENIQSYDLNPITNEINYSINIYANDEYTGTKVYSYNFETEVTSVLIEHLNGSDLVWAPNGVDFAYVRCIGAYENIFVNLSGVEKQVTKYRGKDSQPFFSTNGNKIVFSSDRRGETQIWKVSY